MKFLLKLDGANPDHPHIILVQGYGTRPIRETGNLHCGLSKASHLCKGKACLTQHAISQSMACKPFLNHFGSAVPADAQ